MLNTIKVFRNGFIFQIPKSPLCSCRYTAHSSGSGTGWNETLDVDQAHGLDYQEWNDIRIGIRKRTGQEHVAYADGTVGGIHKPGRSAVLEIGDDTPPATRDGSYGGHSILWDNSSRLWCWTAVAGVTLAPGAPGTADWTVITLHPDLQWGGQDVTWSADHAFAASVCIAGELYVDASMDVSGAANISGAVDITGNVDIVGDITISGDLKVATDFSLTGGMAVDGTSNLTGDVAVGGDFSADGTTVLQNTIIEGDVTFTFSGIAGETGPIFKVFGDWSTRAKTTIFQARTDGYVTTTNAGGNTIQLKTDSNANPTTIRTSSPNIATAGLQACPVKGGDYWCISTLGNPTVYWMPIGDNT